MKKLAALIYTIAYWLDVKLKYVETHDYETAPYCGHHYNGHDGKFTESSYREGDGSAGLKTKNPLLKIYHHTDEGWAWVRPVLEVTERFFIEDREELKPRKRYGVKALFDAFKARKKAAIAGLKITIKVKII